MRNAVEALVHNLKSNFGVQARVALLHAGQRSCVLHQDALPADVARRSADGLRMSGVAYREQQPGEVMVPFTEIQDARPDRGCFVQQRHNGYS